ncbi:Bcl-2-related protein A1 [Holothuria leucospilota]|uniref:Bcl-2-related protein A1 n=1 Tax=Holothuria leucospilota TaxID=206669 RepID=A0A9Q1H1L4_HOLLE|nr:Bcl-2-related protein A1 [Holothuria leucospilota]
MAYTSHGKIARELGEDYVRYKLGLETDTSPSVYAETLRRAGDQVEERYSLALQWMVSQLHYDPILDGERSVRVIFDAVFENEECSWGRIVMVYVFAARLAKYCQAQGYEKDTLEQFGRYAGEYVECHLKRWIEEQGGWQNNFHDTFKTLPRKMPSYIVIFTVLGLWLGGVMVLRRVCSA